MLFKVVVRLFGSVWNVKRLCVELHSPLLRKIFSGIYSGYQYENGSSIAWNASFAGVPCFPHGMKGIFISGGARIGRNCVIFQQVTIGSNTLPGSKGFGAPQVGDNCYIGAGAKIIGNVRVGNNVRVGANAVVYKDVPDNSVVLSGEQRTVLSEIPLDNRFYSFHGKWVYFSDEKWLSVTDEHVLNELSRGSLGC